jgi:hypothetical protein
MITGNIAVEAASMMRLRLALHPASGCEGRRASARRPFVDHHSNLSPIAFSLAIDRHSHSA